MTTIVGDGNNNHLTGGSGGDLIQGLGGDDTLSGNDGNDTIQGGDGADQLFGGDGSDNLTGGAGNDLLRGASGTNTMNGGSGIDTAAYGTSPVGVIVNLNNANPQNTGWGVDTLISIENVNGSTHNDIIFGNSAHNSMSGAGGDDALFGAAGDVLDGGGGTDTASFNGATAGVTVNLGQSGSQDTVGSGHMTFSSIEVLDGTTFDDSLFGGVNAVTLFGGNGDDTLEQGGANSALHGGDGDDLIFSSQHGTTLDGGDGDDVFSAGAGGGVHVDGGAGTDSVVINFTGATGQTIDFTQTGTITLVDGTTLAGLEIYRMSFGSGNDNITGAGGNDSFTGFDGADTLNGGSGFDILFGADGDDVLRGGDDGDNLQGGLGADRLSGGDGADNFFFSAVDESTAADPDLILDLTDDDRIRLEEIDAKTTKAGDQAFKLVDHFTDKAGQATLVYNAAHDRTVLSMDVDGDGVADSVVWISGDHHTFTNFEL